MSSASSGRYQSRLFKFAHQQSRRLTQQCDRAFRHLQVATSTVVPVLLYPIYLLFQSTRSAAKQLYQSSAQLQVDNIDSQPQTPTVDTPIQKVLLAVNSWQSEEAVSTTSKGNKPLNFLALSKLRFSLLPHSPKSTSNLTHSCAPAPLRPITAFLDAPRPTIQGIATQLSSRTLVLVTTENEILDILTAQQQRKLQERIIGEVADYWRYQRLAYSETKKPEYSILYSPSQALAFLDRTVAGLESNYLAPVSEVAITALSFTNALCKRTWEMSQRLSVSLSSKVQPDARKLSATARLNEVTSFDAKTVTFRIQSLILAAINYFFGVSKAPLKEARRGKLAQTTPSANFLKLLTNSKQKRQPLPVRRAYKLPAAAQLNSEDVAPWLTFSDLFGEPELESEPAIFPNPESSISQTTSQAGKTLSLPSNHISKYSLRNLLNRFQTFLLQSKQASGQVLQQKTTVSQTQKITQSALSTTTSSPISQTQVITNKSKQPHTQETQMEPQPDWIETNATAIGYVKHPLEKLLEWLDRVMLWLEELLIRALQRLQRLWQGK